VLLHESLRFRARLTSLVGPTQSEKETVADMSTTNLFVELLVIGVGCASWLALLAMAVLGCDPRFIKGLLSTPAAALPALVGIYLLGIIVDRIADAALHFFRAERRTLKYFPTEEESIKQRGYVLTKSPYFATQFDYSRSRQRICRGWILNAPLLAIALNIFLVARPGIFAHPSRLSAFATPTFLLLAGASWFSWEKLADTELRRIKDQAKWLRESTDASHDPLQ
jgi:hypothetical protein